MDQQHRHLLIATLMLTLGIVITESAGASSWSYYGENGLDSWCSLDNNSCCGDKQSPINLPGRTYQDYVEPFVFTEYDVVPEAMELMNNGHTVEIMIEDEDVKPRISGGGLNNEYVFQQLHFHWGQNLRRYGYNQGSEHTLNWERYDGELHIVHYNSKFDSFSAALASGESDAIAVLGIMLQGTSYGRQANRGLGIIMSELDNVQFSGDESSQIQTFALGELLPRSFRNGFYRYEGSLTTPPCSEVVVWTVFADPIYVTRSMMNELSEVSSTTRGEEPVPLVNNFRPIQRIGTRQIWRLYPGYN